MDLFSPKTIKELLAKHGAAPLKRLGQNFLISPGVLKKIIEAADLDRGEVVLEIGPGLGTLTRELARRVKKVVAIEKDRKFVQILKEVMVNYNNVKIIEEDVLKFPIHSLFVIPAKAGIQDKKSGFRVKPGMTQMRNYKLIANLPYYITSPVIRKFLEAENRPKEMILMLQKEVAQRICARPPDMSLLAVSVQFYAEPKIISYVSKGSFWPSPKVDSAIIKITPYSDPDIPARHRQAEGVAGGRKHLNDPNIFFKVARAGFSAPRKQLAGNLSRNLEIDRQTIEAALKKAKIQPQQRAETLDIKSWITLAEIIKPHIN